MAQDVRNPCASVYDLGMDALASLLEGPRAREAFLLRSVMAPPGRCGSRTRPRSRSWPSCGARPGSSPTAANRSRWPTGGVAVVRGPGHYSVADDPGRDATGGDPPRPGLHHGWPASRWSRPWRSACGPGGTARRGRPCCSPAPTSTAASCSARLLDGLPVVVSLSGRRVGEPAGGAAGRGDLP